MGPATEALDRTAKAVAASIEAVFADMEDIARTLESAASGMEGKPNRSEFAFLKEDFVALIKKHSPVIEGAGVAYAPGSLAEVPTWLEWWRVQQGAEPRFHTHDLNPASIRYYDYSSRDWFRIPSSSGTAIAIGPYVDLGGINVNTITLTVPVQTSFGTHVLGGDVSLSGIEEVFLKSLRTRRPTVVLLGPNGRVITSNSAHIATGTLLSETGPVVESRQISDSDPARLPWKLVALGEQG